MAKIFPSKFASTCNCGCGQSYPEGAQITRGERGWVLAAHGQAQASSAAEASARRMVFARKAAAERAKIQATREIIGGPDVADLKESLGLSEPVQPESALIDCVCGFLHRRDVACL